MDQLGLGDYGSDDEDQSHKSEDEAVRADALPAGLGTSKGLSSAPDVDMESGPRSEEGSEGGHQGSHMDVEAAAGAPEAGASGASPRDWLSLLPQELRQAPPGQHSKDAEIALRRTIAKSQQLKRTFIDSLRSNRDYSNPDLLQALRERYELKEYGTSLSPDVFDPDALPREDFADALLAQLDRDQEARRAAREHSRPGQATIAFERGTGAGGMLPASTSASDLQRSAVPPAGTSAPIVGGAALLAAQKAAELAAQHAAAAAGGGGGRRSKWDTGR